MPGMAGSPVVTGGRGVRPALDVAPWRAEAATTYGVPMRASEALIARPVDAGEHACWLRVGGAAPIVRRCCDPLGLDTVMPRKVAP